MGTYTRLGRLLLLSGLLAGVAACAQKSSAPPAPPALAGGDWQQRCEMMQQYCQSMHTAKTPEERQKLMEEHWQLMRQNKMMPDACPMGGGMGMGPGMMGQGMGPGVMGPGMMGGQGMGPGPMTGSPTAEQLDQRIQHVEAMLKQLKEQRARMGK